MVKALLFDRHGELYREVDDARGPEVEIPELVPQEPQWTDRELNPFAGLIRRRRFVCRRGERSHPTGMYRIYREEGGKLPLFVFEGSQPAP